MKKSLALPLAVLFVCSLAACAKQPAEVYENYFHITAAGTPEKYNAVVDLYFVPFLEFLHGSEDIEALKAADYTEDAAAYLKSGGMTEAEIAALISLITAE